ncbi:MAG: DUF983 domain-containing protein [Variibacter sp.]|nr:DUF983 domain-containing protein [Variibacter sp.]
MTWTDTTPARPRRPLWPALLRGFFGRCPHCGKGKLFNAFLKVNHDCAVCGEEFHHQRADDAPAYFVILIVGHLMVPMALSLETAWAPPYWVHLVIWAPLTIGLAVGLLQPVKGVIIAVQWANYMHGFDPATAEPEPETLPAPKAAGAAR